MYIKQINADIYVGNIEGYEDNLELHPCMETGFFEIVDGDTPEHYTILLFSMPE